MEEVGFSPDISSKLKELPVFVHCTANELVRLVPHVIERVHQVGETLFKSGEAAHELFYVADGAISLNADGKALQEIRQGFLGEEAAVKAPKYLGDAVAIEPTRVYVFPADSVINYLGKNAKVGRAFYSSLLSHYAGNRELFDIGVAGDGKTTEKAVSRGEMVGWALAVILPLLVWVFGMDYGLEIKARLFAMVFSSITVMWVFRLMAEFIPCILGFLALIVLGVAPHKDVLQGFSSGEFFMAMSIFGVGAVLVTSGLTFRLVLLILRYIPASPFFHSFSMIISGIFLTPILPSANGRIGLAGPIMVDMLEALEYKPKGKAATTIAIGTFTGFTLFASVFLTSKPINFVVYGLLPLQVQDQFQWLGWFSAAAVSGTVLLLLSLIFLFFFSRSDEKPRLSSGQIEAQLRMLGPLSQMEWTALISVGIFIVGIGISSWHKIDPPWVALGILSLLLAMDALHRKEFHERVDWSFVLYLAGLIGLVKTMSSVGIDTLIAQNLTFVGPLMRDQFGMFVLVLFFSIMGVRLIVPNNATIAIFCTILLPLAQVNGVNPWVVGYMILTFSDGWFAPYQCTYYLFFLQLTEGSGWYDAKALLKFNLLTNLFRLVAIFASLPYWKWMGII
jgi:DASS family divalent anion:Na+ symporter